MPKFNVMINWTQTIERSFEIEVSASDEEMAEVKATERAKKIADSDCVKRLSGWEETNVDNQFEYEVSE
jgi:hypothetical protein